MKNHHFFQSSKLLRTLLILLFMAVSTQGVTAQLNLSSSHTTLEAVIKQIQSQSKYQFFYSDKLSTVTVDVQKMQNASLEAVLNQVLKGKNISFKVEDNIVYLSEKNQIPQESQKQQSGKERKITGQIVDETGEPLIGVNVLIKGSTNGVITDIDGNYTLNTNNGNPVLQFSYIGYKPQEVNAKSQNIINLTLHSDTQMIDEVVVTAMGIERAAKSLTYATQTVKGDELTRAKDANFINSLQGKSAGLVITPNSGGAGSASKILLRGNSSILGSNNPLIVIDGIPMTNSVNGKVTTGGNIDYGSNNEGSDILSTMNPDDIENISVLKGANAAALYGSNAANGVIMITTKRGKEGKISVDVSSSSLFERPLTFPKFQNTFGATLDYINSKYVPNEFSWGGRMDAQTPEQLATEGVTGEARDNLSDFFNTGTNFNNSISISGGTDKVQSYFSVGNTIAKGMVPNNKFNRTILNLKENFSLFNKKLDINVSANYIHQKTNNPIGGGKGGNPLYNLYTTPRNVDMKYYKENYEKWDTWDSEIVSWRPEYDDKIKDPSYYKTKYTTYKLSGMAQNWFRGRRGTPSANNPYWTVNRALMENLLQRFYGTVDLKYHIIKGLDVQARFSYDRTDIHNDNRNYATTVTLQGTIDDRGSCSFTDSWKEELFADFLLSYNKTFAKDYSLIASVGGSWNKTLSEERWMRNTASTDRTIYTDPSQFPTSINEFYFHTGMTPTRSYFVASNWFRAAFATASLGWKEAAYLDFSYRMDWSRAFTQFANKPGVNTYYGYYAIGANAILNELIAMPEVIDRLKIRASYSEVGNSVPNTVFNGQTYNSATGVYNPTIYSEFDHPMPETLRSLEVGADISLFNAALNWDITYYNTHMFNQYLAIAGASGKIKPINSGEVRNQGIETTLSYNMIINKDWRWRTGVNFSYNDNKILHTYKGKDDVYTSIGAGSPIYARYREGGSYGDLYVMDFKRYTKNHENKGVGKAGDIMLSPEGLPQYDTQKGHEKYIGNMNAKCNLGWHNTISYKDFSFYFLFDGKIGGKVVSFTEAYLDYFGVSERTGEARLSGLEIKHPKTGEMVPAAVMPDGNLAPAKEYYQTIGSQIFASEYIYNATNIRLRELSVSYTFRNVFGPGKNISASVVGRNLFFLFKDAPIDPDASLSTGNSLGGIEMFNYPTARSFGLNLKLSF